MTITDDYVKITLTNKLIVTPYNSEDVQFELEDVFYNSNGSKYVICERKDLESGKQRLVQPLIDKYQKIVDDAMVYLNALKAL